MFCGKCGTQVQDGVRFCPNCGNILDNDLTENNDLQYDNFENNSGFDLSNTEFKKPGFLGKVKKWQIIVGVIVIIVIAVPVIYFSLPSTKIIACLNDGEYEEASEIYGENYKSGKGDFLLNKGLLDIANKSRETLINSEPDSDSSDLFQKVYTITNMNISEIDKEVEEIYSSMASLSSDRNTMSVAQEDFDDGKYFAAMNEYNSISEDSLLYETAKAKADEAKNAFKELVTSQIDSYINEGDSYGLTVYISNNLYTISDDDFASEMMGKYRSYLQSESDTLLANDSYEDAKYILEDAIDYFPEDKEISEMLDNLESKYVDSSIEKAQEEFNNGNYEKAASTVQVAMEQFEDNQQLKNKYNEYKAYLPAYLNDLDYFNKDSDIYTNGNFDKVADNTGKEYGRAYCVGYMDGSAEYLINGNYTNFEGICGVAYEKRTEERSKFFEVYGDGVLLYKSPVFTAGTMPETFNINITGVKILKILYPESDGYCKTASIFDGKLYNANNVKKSENILGIFV